LKENFDRSPLVSKSAVDNECTTLVWDIQPDAPTEPALSKELVDDIVDILDTNNKDSSPLEDKKQPMALKLPFNKSLSVEIAASKLRKQKEKVAMVKFKDVHYKEGSTTVIIEVNREETLNRSPSPTIGVVPQKNLKAQVVAAKPKDVDLKKVEVAGAKSKDVDSKEESTFINMDVPLEEPIIDSLPCVVGTLKAKKTKEKAIVAIVKEVDSKKGSTERKLRNGEGDSTDGAMLHTADGFLEASKMLVNNVPRATTTTRPSPKKPKKQRQPSPP
jgi:hypothetical protein